MLQWLLGDFKRLFILGVYTSSGSSNKYALYVCHIGGYLHDSNKWSCAYCQISQFLTLFFDPCVKDEWLEGPNVRWPRRPNLWITEKFVHSLPFLTSFKLPTSFFSMLFCQDNAFQKKKKIIQVYAHSCVHIQQIHNNLYAQKPCGTLPYTGTLVEQVTYFCRNCSNCSYAKCTIL